MYYWKMEKSCLLYTKIKRLWEKIRLGQNTPNLCNFITKTLIKIITGIGGVNSGTSRQATQLAQSHFWGQSQCRKISRVEVPRQCKWQRSSDLSAAQGENSRTGTCWQRRAVRALLGKEALGAVIIPYSLKIKFKTLLLLQTSKGIIFFILLKFMILFALFSPIA